MFSFGQAKINNCLQKCFRTYLIHANNYVDNDECLFASMTFKKIEQNVKYDLYTYINERSNTMLLYLLSTLKRKQFFFLRECLMTTQCINISSIVLKLI